MEPSSNNIESKTTMQSPSTSLSTLKKSPFFANSNGNLDKNSSTMLKFDSKQTIAGVNDKS